LRRSFELAALAFPAAANSLGYRIDYPL
jgi:hypothetical protein